jgi:hypothetical protein
MSVVTATKGVEGVKTERVRAATVFYSSMSGALLLIVLLGFGRSLYLRPYFNNTPLAPSVLTHGIVLTTWYVLAFVQALLVASRRVGVHRRLGWGVVGAGVAALVASTFVTVNFLARRRASGTNIIARIAGLSAIVWGDIAALLAFVVFFPLAIALRRRPEAHKRLMLLSSMSLLEPAMFRIWGWSVFRGVNRDVASLVVLLALLMVLALYDLGSLRRVHAATVAGGALLLGSRAVALFVIAGSEVGRSFIRALAGV